MGSLSVPGIRSGSSEAEDARKAPPPVGILRGRDLWLKTPIKAKPGVSQVSLPWLSLHTNKAPFPHGTKALQALPLGAEARWRKVAYPKAAGYGCPGTQQEKWLEARKVNK